MTRIVAGILALGLSGAVSLAQECPSGLVPMTEAQLFFGLSIPGGGKVSEAAWRHFADTQITPRFPDGLTVEDARGQWKGASGPVHEPAKHLIILLPDNETAKLEAIRAAYKSRFQQQSVLLTQTRVCGSF